MSDPFTEFMTGHLAKRHAEQDRRMFLFLSVTAGVLVLVGLIMLVT
jgi:hypothetical protein